MALKLIRREQELAEITPKWQELWRRGRSANPFLAAEWVCAWWRWCGRSVPEASPYVLAEFDGSRIVGVAPLMVRTATRSLVGIRKVEFMGGQLVDYNGLLADDPPAFATAIAQHLRSAADDWDILHFRDVAEADQAVLAPALAAAGLQVRASYDSVCPFLELNDGLEALVSSLPGNLRSNLRRYRRRRAALAGLTIRVREECHEQASSMNLLFQLERQQLSTRPQGWIPLAAEDTFFVSALAELSRMGAVYVGTMELGERLLAFEVGFRCGRKLWGYKSAFDPQFAAYSPGTGVREAVLEYAFRKGCDEYDFLRGDEPYKFEWTRAVHHTWQLRAWKPSARSRLTARLYFQIRSGLKHLARCR